MAVNIISLTLLTLLTKNTYGAEIAQLNKENDAANFILETQERIVEEVEP